MVIGVLCPRRRWHAEMSNFPIGDAKHGLARTRCSVRMELKHGHWKPLDRPAREAHLGQGVALVIFQGRSVACSHVTLYSAHLSQAAPLRHATPLQKRKSPRSGVLLPLEPNITHRTLGQWLRARGGAGFRGLVSSRIPAKPLLSLCWLVGRRKALVAVKPLPADVLVQVPCICPR